MNVSGAGVFWKPGSRGPDARETRRAARPRGHVELDTTMDDRESERWEQGQVLVHNPLERYSLRQQREALPIFKHRRQLLYMVETHRVVVLVGETGSGKTTQVPQYLYEAGWAAGGRQVACTQPRRIAAQEVAARVAEEQGAELGGLVGYTVRFDDCSHADNTRIKYLTDGMLVRETMFDPLLLKYSVIMLDEAHERSLYTDILLGLLKKILRKRKDLRVIVSSATLDAENYFDFFDEKGKENYASIISIPGRCFPIEVFYLQEASPSYTAATVDTVMKIHAFEGVGDILCFLTGQREIEETCRAIEESLAEYEYDLSKGGVRQRPTCSRMQVLPLFAGLPAEYQRSVFEAAPAGVRKVILSTNVAETSVTIPGVAFVVDSGMEKIRLYEHSTGQEALVVVPCSRSSAKQRAGRAGRERPGKVFRLFTEDAHDRVMEAQQTPEVQRCNLTQVVLQLKALGIDDIIHFDFLSAPPTMNLANALELLYALGALDDDCRLTEPFGVTIAEFPIEPCLAKMLLASGQLGCTEEILSIAAMLSVPNVFIVGRDRTLSDKLKKKFAVHEGDHVTLLNVYLGFQGAKNRSEWCKRHHLHYKNLCKAERVRRQLRAYCNRFDVPMRTCGDDTVAIRKSITSGFFANAAKLQPNSTYRTVRGGHVLHLHPTSVLFKYPPKWVIYNEVMRTTEDYMRDVTAVEVEWIAEAAPHFYDFKKLPK